jgi:small subunit ribosomal protein S19
MRIPFVDYQLYTKVMQQPLVHESDAKSIEADNVAIQTNSRSSTIVNAFIGRTIAVYSGNKSQRLDITEAMVGYKLGCFSFTKKLGKSIHNSEHNRKKIAKMKRKITQKKVRKATTTTAKTTAKKKK